MSEVRTADVPAATDAAESCPHDCRRHQARGPLLAVVGWLLAALAAVSVALIPCDADESLCGVWGCFPPLFALVSLHLLWCVALAACVWAVGRWLPGLLRPLGFLLVIATVAATGEYVGRDLVHWLAGMPEELRHYWPRRIGYRVLTLTDVPLVECLFVGVVCAVRGRRVSANGQRGYRGE